jgi:peptidoglycan/LPS O-acetylase OafA/YrhL
LPLALEKTPAKGESIDILNALRALAAVMVCLFHASFLIAPFSSLTNQVLDLGQFGVYVFFVISGVVIPLALEKVNYRLNDFPMYMAKRIVRLMPPLIVSATIVAISSWFALHTDAITLLHQWLASITLTAPIVNVPWLNEVYWTLYVEMQYYVYIGLLFPFLHRASDKKRRVIVSLILVSSFISLWSPGYAQSKLPFQLPVFVMGLITYFHYRNIFSRKEYFAWLALSTGVCFYLNGYLHGYSYWIGIMAALTSLTIAHVHRGPRLLSALGEYSYSFYLMHWPVISALCFLAGNVLETLSGAVMTFVAVLLGSTVVARLFYSLTEQPALRWSRRLHYKRADSQKD